MAEPGAQEALAVIQMEELPSAGTSVLSEEASASLSRKQELEPVAEPVQKAVQAQEAAEPAAALLAAGSIM